MTPELAPNRWLRPPEGTGAKGVSDLEESIRLGQAPFLAAAFPFSPRGTAQRELRAELTRRLVGAYRFINLDVDSKATLKELLTRLPHPEKQRLIVFWSGFETLDTDACISLIQDINLAREALRASGAVMVFLLAERTLDFFGNQALDLMAWMPPATHFQEKLIPATRFAAIPYPDLVARLDVAHNLSSRVFEGELTSSRVVLAKDLIKRLNELGLAMQSRLVALKLHGFLAKHIDKLESLYLDYVANQYQRLDVFSITEDAPITIELVKPYVKLKIERYADERGKTPGHKDKQKESFEFEARFEPRELDVDSAVAQHSRLVILGSPGSGKTTLLKYLALNGARGRGKPGEHKVPILLTASDLARELTEQTGSRPHLPDMLAGVFRKRAAWLELNAEFFGRLLNEGRGGLLIDGLDEVAQSGVRQQVVAKIQSGSEQWPECQWIVTSRPHGFQTVAPQGLPGFVSAQAMALDDAGIADFVKGWYQAVECAAHGDTTGTRDKAHNQADRLLTAIRAAQGVRDLAGNPLLLGVLALVHRRNVTLPQRRSELYDECTQQLLGFWDQVQGREVSNSDFSRDDKRYLLQPLARWFHERGAAGITADQATVVDELQRLIVRLFGDAPVEAGRRAKEFLRDIQERAGLLLEREDGLFAFSHLTFQEYLAARAISEEEEDKQQDIVLQHLHDPWWREVTLLLAGHLADVRHQGQRGRRMSVRLIRAVREARSPKEEILRRDLLLAGRMACDLGKLGVDEEHREWTRGLLQEVSEAWAQSPFTFVVEESQEILALAPDWAISDGLRAYWQALVRGKRPRRIQDRSRHLVLKLLAFRRSLDIHESLIEQVIAGSRRKNSAEIWWILATSNTRDTRLVSVAERVMKTANLWLASLAAQVLWQNQRADEVHAWLEELPEQGNESWPIHQLLENLAPSSQYTATLVPLITDWLDRGDWRSHVALWAIRLLRPATLTAAMQEKLLALVERTPPEANFQWSLWAALVAQTNDNLLDQAVRTSLSANIQKGPYRYRLQEIIPRLQTETAKQLIDQALPTEDGYYAIVALKHMEERDRDWALARLRGIANQTESPWVVAALRVLHELGAENAIERLEQISQTGSAWRKTHAVFSLGLLDEREEFPSWCRRALRDRSVTVRAECASYLARRVRDQEDPTALEQLLILARQTSRTCREKAWEALGSLPPTPLLDGWWLERFRSEVAPAQVRNAAVALTLRFSEHPQPVQKQLGSYWEGLCRQDESTTRSYPGELSSLVNRHYLSVADLAYDMLRGIVQPRTSSKPSALN